MTRGLPLGIAVSDANYCTVGPRFESQRRHGCLQMQSAGTVCRYLSSCKSSQVVGGRESEVGVPWTLPRVFSHKNGVEQSQIILSPVGCSKLG
ncbi:hypothetical protein TNCV_4391361 [Trichonephila clavipes]|nr:hypothetical protein TNCV_4391361 [Trichonephila clavipes]